MTTKIEFQVRKDQNNKLLVCSPADMVGQYLPNGFISKHKHAFSEDGSTGWVEVPISILAGGVGSGEMKVIGVKEETDEECQRRLKNEAIAELSSNQRKSEQWNTTSPNQEWMDQPEGFQLLNPTELEKDKYFAAKPLEDLSQEDELFEGPEQINTNKPGDAQIEVVEDGVLWGAAGVLHVLGLVPRPNKNGSVHRWYHPAFGDDKPDNHLLFDLETDSMSDIGFKLFRLGARLGTRVLKLQIQNTLEQH